MGNHQELDGRLSALIEAADWADLVPRLQAFARAHLSLYGEAPDRRWQSVTHAYVLRTISILIERRADLARWHEWSTLFELLCRIIAQLIDDDDRRLEDLLEKTDWADIVPRVIAQTVRQLGPRTGRHGKSPEDYVYEAVLQLITRRRHFPVDRGVTVFTFLCKVVHGMRTNDIAGLAAEGRHLTIVDGDEVGPDEYRADWISVSADEANDAVAATALESFIATLEPDLREYAQLRAEEKYRTAKEYAAALHVTEQTIRNYDRRLRRRRPDWGR